MLLTNTSPLVHSSVWINYPVNSPEKSYVCYHQLIHLTHGFKMINREELKAVIKEAVQEVLVEKGLIKNDEDDLIDVEAAAKLLNLANATIYEKTSKRILPHYKKGKKIVFKVSELREWLESGKVMTEEDIQRSAVQYLQRKDQRRR